MEEQVATLIQLLEEQKQSQQELAASQEKHFESLTLEMLGHQRRVEEQQSKLQEWQMQTEDRLEGLQRDFKGAQEELQERVCLAETRMGQLQKLYCESQTRQLESLEELQQLMFCLGRETADAETAKQPSTETGVAKQEDESEPEGPKLPPCATTSVKLEEATSVPVPTTKNSGPVKESPTSVLGKESSSLRLEALPFTPRGGIEMEPVVTEREGVGEIEEADITVRRPMHRPSAYDGKSSWEAYFTQFEMLADLNRWGVQEKASYLAVSLRGSALTVLTNLPAGQRRDYDALTKALQNRFGTGHQTELNRAKLRGRVRRREETLPALAEDVERLTRLA